MAAPASLRWIIPDAKTHRPSARLLPLLRAAVAAAPQRLEPKLQLARALFRADRLDDLVDWLGPLIEDAEAPAELLFHLGCAYAVLGDEPQALVALRAAASRCFGPALGYLAEILLRQERSDDALLAGLRGLDEQPADFKPLGIVARILLERTQPAWLWDVCLRLRGRGAWDGYIPSAMAHAAMSPSQCAEVTALVDRERWFGVRDRGGPAGFAPELADDFDRELGRELLTHPALSRLPATKATTGTGNRIDQLHLTAGPRAQDLLKSIRDAVDGYLTDRMDAAWHPLVVHRPQAVSLAAWAVSVCRDGHETWHLHARGWISGVYYVDVPAGLVRNECAGAIDFGPMPFGTKRPAPSWPQWRVRPRPGQLLLFPSFYGHRTWPTGSEEARLCVAFDVVPAAADAPDSS